MKPSANTPRSRLGGRRVWLGGVSALATLAVLAVLTAEKPPSSPPSPLALVLPARPRCSVARAAALTRARLLEQQAEAQRARYPFAPEVGRTVWSSWSEAADCRRLADDGPAARRNEALAASWQVGLEDDLRASQLRLERALARSEPAAAAGHARQLLALLPATDGTYRRWLLQIRAVGGGKP